ncbi:HAMP domain-containing sensor histidine kinase [Piscinibacter sp.]|uniref:HAMP domain-containing sensor histidine kinase n=1 Tax=Piscinibacter sp. TaxID=1903157 RepID=UPI002BF0CCC8|nr:HAMP domain-containing sensor histidine kinase [Albitalea sp.]HUG23158.1 HAMP domain-containing sensor histidine kinase [Albitalea sp.]
MNTLTLRIYLTVVAVLALFAFASGWIFQRHIEHERSRAESVLSDRVAGWGELIQRSLPSADASPEHQAAALQDWSKRLRLPLALDGPDGTRIGVSESFQRRQDDGGRGLAIRLEDGRTLWLMRPGLRGQPPDGRRQRAEGTGFPGFPFTPPGMPRAFGLVLVLALLFVAVALGAWPVVRRLTRRLQALKQGMQTFGAGRLDHRVEVSGRDELAAVAASFNDAAERIEALVRSHQSLLANASHELRSPLARMKMAVAMLEEADPAQRDRLKQEIDTDISELDALVEEVLLASRLDALRDLEQRERVDLMGLAAEEAARVDATLDAARDSEPLVVTGDERLLRRALRNLLENAKRYGGDDVSVSAERMGRDTVLRVWDRGPGVPEGQRERIFEPFYRLPGHAETSGGVGLGLSLVKQIAQRHGGHVRCEPRDGGGSCFVLTLPSNA